MNEKRKTKHVMSLTYKPKIEPVLDGRCTQTIRKGRRFAVGDEILMHGWAGLPYRSKWNWSEQIVVSEVIDIFVSARGVAFWKAGIYYIHHWNHEYCDRLAELDFINPPTGEALRGVLFGLNGVPEGHQEYQIIRWLKP